MADRQAKDPKLYVFPTWPGNVGMLWKVGRKLGEGGFGSVYMVEHKQTGQTRACKMIRKNTGKKLKFDIIQREVDILIKMGEHPNICGFSGGYETSKRVYIIIPFCTGGDIYAVLSKKKRLKASFVRSIISQMCEALRFCHEKGIVHCDLKPENALFKDKEFTTVLLCDFGLAKCKEKFKWLKQVGGTPMYIAPECLNKRYSQAADMWAIGVMTFEMFYGYLPFRTKRSPVETIREAAKGFNPQVKAGRGNWHNKNLAVPDKARDFMNQLLVLETHKRLTAKEALDHPWNQESLDMELQLTHLFDIRHHCDQAKANNLAHELARASDLQDWMIRDVKAIFVALMQDDTEARTLRRSKRPDVDWDTHKTLSVKLFKQGVRNIICKNSPIVEDEFLNEMFGGIDDDGNGYIDLDEFLQEFAWLHLKSCDERIYKMVQDMDVGNDGKICFEDVVRYSKNCPTGNRLSKETLDSIEKQFKKNDGKAMEFAEFLEKNF